MWSGKLRLWQITSLHPAQTAAHVFLIKSPETAFIQDLELLLSVCESLRRPGKRQTSQDAIRNFSDTPFFGSEQRAGSLLDQIQPICGVADALWPCQWKKLEPSLRVLCSSWVREHTQKPPGDTDSKEQDGNLVCPRIFCLPNYHQVPMISVITELWT